jgi:hypothetical protein
MDRTGMEPARVEPGGIDRILATEEELVPSSGFLTSVMESIEEEAKAPKPIPFPWKLALPGMVIAVVAFVWLAVEFVRIGLQAARSNTLVLPHLPAAAVEPLEEAGWVALALGASLLSWLLSRRLAGRSGLL